MRHRVYLVFALCAVLGVCSVVQAESASVRLERGLYQEETVGDLAATLYRGRVVSLEALQGKAEGLALPQQ